MDKVKYRNRCRFFPLAVFVHRVVVLIGVHIHLSDSVLSQKRRSYDLFHVYRKWFYPEPPAHAHVQAFLEWPKEEKYYVRKKFVYSI